MRNFMKLIPVVLALQLAQSVRAERPSFVEGEIIVSPAAVNGLLRSSLAGHGLRVINEDAISGLLLVATPRGEEQAWIDTLADDAMMPGELPSLG